MATVCRDEIGVYGFSGGGYGENTSAALMNSFVFWNGGGINGGLPSDDGTTVIAPLRRKNGVTDFVI